MNYQLLIESYSFGTTLNKQEIELLCLELETQILNLDISSEWMIWRVAAIIKTGKGIFQAMKSDPKQINVKKGQGNKVTYDPSKM